MKYASFMIICIQFFINIMTRTALILCLSISASSILHGQSCTICSQHDVGTFVGDLSGHVMISGSDTTNLDALNDNLDVSFLAFWSLTIIDNPVLTDMSGIATHSQVLAPISRDCRSLTL